jgi:hypothetical protein
MVVTSNTVSVVRPYRRPTNIWLKRKQIPFGKKIIFFILFTFTALLYSFGMFSLERSSLTPYFFTYERLLFSQQGTYKNKFKVFVME